MNPFQKPHKFSRNSRGQKPPKDSKDTSWNKVGDWYNKITGDAGHYYHKHVVMPGVYRLLGLKKDDNVLDIGCGQGILERSIPKDVSYLGVDKAETMIDAASHRSGNPLHTFRELDAMRPLPVPEQSFSHVAIVLALQNMRDPEVVISHIPGYLKPDGKLVIVLNHPAFRIPRHSSWENDVTNKIQYRRINRYMSPLEIPITAHPGKRHSDVTWSFHHPISYYVDALAKAGFVIEKMEEWTSDKESVGAAAFSENRARAEFPLFLAIKASLK